MNENADEPVVWVRRQWNDVLREASYKRSHIQGVHWDTVSGGVNAPAPQPLLHGYVPCDMMIEGELAHSCRHGRGPHSVKVCIVKKGNDPNVFAELAALAGPKPTRRSATS